MLSTAKQAYGQMVWPLLNDAKYHTKTIWLFTRSDLKTIVVPSTLFAVLLALSGFERRTELDPLHTVLHVLERLPLTLFWVWMNLLPFNISNQRQPDSIAEDLENKPWRSLPSERITPENAASLMKVCYALAALVSLQVGGVLQCVALMALGYWYNDARGADCNFALRNLINGAGYVSFVSGALEIILHTSVTNFQPRTLIWILMIGAVIVTSIHAQDLPDQAGDALRSRRTLPLVLGDGIARWMLAVSISIWSFLCPAFWQLGHSASALPVLVGMIISGRFLLCRTVSADKTTFLVYNLWIIVLFSLPLMKRIQIASTLPG